TCPTLSLTSGRGARRMRPAHPGHFRPEGFPQGASVLLLHPSRIVPMLARRVRVVFLLVGAAGFLGGAAAVTGHYLTTHPDYLFRKGQKALAGGNSPEALRLADVLKERGHPDHEHLLRGLCWVSEGKAALAEAAGPASPRQQSQWNEEARKAFR